MHLTALGIPIRIGQMGVMVLSTIYSIQTASYSVTRPFVTPLCWIQALVPSPKFIKFLALSFGHAFSIIPPTLPERGMVRTHSSSSMS